MKQTKNGDDQNSSLSRGMSYGGTGGASSHRG